MHIIKQKNSIRIKPGIKPTHISIKGNHVKVGQEPMEFMVFAIPGDINHNFDIKGAKLIT